jgi:hypothetical protein
MRRKGQDGSVFKKGGVRTMIGYRVVPPICVFGRMFPGG